MLYLFHEKFFQSGFFLFFELGKFSPEIKEDFLKSSVSRNIRKAFFSEKITIFFFYFFYFFRKKYKKFFSGKDFEAGSGKRTREPYNTLF